MSQGVAQGYGKGLAALSDLILKDLAHLRAMRACVLGQTPVISTPGQPPGPTGDAYQSPGYFAGTSAATSIRLDLALSRQISCVGDRAEINDYIKEYANYLAQLHDFQSYVDANRDVFVTDSMTNGIAVIKGMAIAEMTRLASLPPCETPKASPT